MRIRTFALLAGLTLLVLVGSLFGTDYLMNVDGPWRIGNLTAGTLIFPESGTAPHHYSQFTGGDQSANLAYILPTAYGSAGYVLADTDGAGTLAWAAGTFSGDYRAGPINLGDANEFSGAIKIGTAGATGAITIGNESAAMTLNGVADINFSNDSKLYIATVTVTNAQLKALSVTPKVIVATPGAHNMVEVVSAVLIHDYAGAQFDANTETLGLYYTNKAGTLLTSTVTQTLLLGTASADRMAKLTPAACAGAAANTYENLAVVLACSVGDPIGGSATGVVRVICSYRIHATGL